MDEARRLLDVEAIASELFRKGNEAHFSLLCTGLVQDQSDAIGVAQLSVIYQWCVEVGDSKWTEGAAAESLGVDACVYAIRAHTLDFHGREQVGIGHCRRPSPFLVPVVTAIDRQALGLPPCYVLSDVAERFPFLRSGELAIEIL